MTDAPPPAAPPPSAPPPAVPPRGKEPGFLACGGLVFVGFIVVGGVGSFLSELANWAGWASGSFSLAVLGLLIYQSIRDPRFAKCLAKGLLVNFAVFAILAGVCIAALRSSGL